MIKIRNLLGNIVIFVLLITSLFLISMALKEEYPLWKNQNDLEKLQEEIGKSENNKEKSSDIDWKKLKEINQDIVGWIKVPGTKIDYPILKNKTWNEYLHKNYKGDYSYPGSIFIQPENSLDDKHVVIYGHNMRIKSMFGSLHNYEAEDFYKKHQKIFIYQPQRTIEAVIYSTYDCQDKTDVYKIKFSNEKEWKKWISISKKNNSYYPIKRKVKEEDKVITLSTCSGKDKGQNSRYIVHTVIQKINR